MSEYWLYRQLQSEMIEAAKIVECVSCHARVPIGSTQVTSAGYVCDTCTR